MKITQYVLVFLLALPLTACSGVHTRKGSVPAEICDSNNKRNALVSGLEQTLCACKAPCPICDSWDSSKKEAWTKRAIETEKSIVEMAGNYLSWCLAILAGSIIALLGDGYLKPVGWQGRIVYLLFLGGWFFLGKTFLSYDDLVTDRLSMLTYQGSTSQVCAYSCEAEYHYAIMRQNFERSLYFWGAWLLVMVGLFICNRLKPAEK